MSGREPELCHAVKGEPLGPDGMARECRARIAELEAERAKATGSQRNAINGRLRTLRSLLKFATTRVGYTGFV